jgi:hypothetical protein
MINNPPPPSNSKIIEKLIKVSNFFMNWNFDFKLAIDYRRYKNTFHSFEAYKTDPHLTDAQKREYIANYINMPNIKTGQTAVHYLVQNIYRPHKSPKSGFPVIKNWQKKYLTRLIENGRDLTNNDIIGNSALSLIDNHIDRGKFKNLRIKYEKDNEVSSLSIDNM